ncbi:MAG: TrmH family RNA methyltransferase [Planctomycetia bacterium]
MIPHDTITSAANPRIRQAARLREPSARRESGLTLIDGRRELSRAIAAGVAIEEVFVDADSAHALLGDGIAIDPDAGSSGASGLAELAAHGTRLTALSRKAFERIAFGGRNEGVVGVARYQPHALGEFAVAVDRPVLVVEGVEKPGNLGAILRTADAAGLAGVVVCDGRTDPANPAAIRASLGTVFTVPLAMGSTADTIRWCQAHDRRVVAAMPTGTTLWHEARLAGRTAILLGSEAHGISPAWQQAAAAGTIHIESVRLTMAGVADSLNVSATTAVLAYEAVRQGTTTGRTSQP